MEILFSKLRKSKKRHNLHQSSYVSRVAGVIYMLTFCIILPHTTTIPPILKYFKDTSSIVEQRYWLYFLGFKQDGYFKSADYHGFSNENPNLNSTNDIILSLNIISHQVLAPAHASNKLSQALLFTHRSKQTTKQLCKSQFGKLKFEKKTPNGCGTLKILCSFYNLL